MIIAKITEEVKDIVFGKIIDLGTNYTSIYCVLDCDDEWYTSLEEVTAYNSQYPNPVYYEEKEYCKKCDPDVDEC